MGNHIDGEYSRGENISNKTTSITSPNSNSITVSQDGQNGEKLSGVCVSEAIFDTEKYSNPRQQESTNTPVDEAGNHPNSMPNSSTSEFHDPNMVHWEGEDDPEKPQNWRSARKWTVLALVSAFTFMSPVASSILAPSLRTIGKELHITSESEISLCLSIFVLGFAFGPLVLAPLSEMYGRAIILQSSNALFMIFNLACGFAKTKEQLIIFRFLAGVGGSAPLALGSGVLADLFAPENRGRAIAIYSFFPILGPAVGPICGGFIEQYTSWRWAFWSTTIANIPVLVLGTCFLEETYPPVLLLWRKSRIFRETGNVDVYTKFEQQGLTLSKKLAVSIIRPIKLIGTQPIIIIMGLYQAYLYGLMYVVLTTFPKLWSDKYDESVSIAGLNYISLGLGYCAGIQLSAHTQDGVYRHLKSCNNNIGIPEFRVPLLLPVAVLLPLGFFIYGWTAAFHTHWIWPNVGAFIFAAGIMMGTNALITYVVDAYQTYSASAAAATTVLRSLAGFLFPMFAPNLYQALGYGWGNSLLGFVAIAIGVPAPIGLWYYGAKLRGRSTFATG